MSFTSPVDFTNTALPVVHGQDIRFVNYEDLLDEAKQVSSFLENLEVTADTESDVKQMVANARKLTTKINETKKQVKKMIMEPYYALEDQAKTLIATVEEGESLARQKLGELDLERRNSKRAEIEEIWNLRAYKFAAGQYVPFDSFVNDKHLNKTMSMNQVETDMVKFLEGTSEDIVMLQKMEYPEELIEEYLKTFNVTKAIDAVTERHNNIANLHKQEHYMVIRITGRADCTLAKQLLSEINYKILEEC